MIQLGSLTLGTSRSAFRQILVFPLDQQRFICAGHQAQDHEAIIPGGTYHLVLRLRGGYTPARVVWSRATPHAKGHEYGRGPAPPAPAAVALERYPPPRGNMFPRREDSPGQPEAERAFTQWMASARRMEPGACALDVRKVRLAWRRRGSDITVWDQETLLTTLLALRHFHIPSSVAERVADFLALEEGTWLRGREVAGVTHVELVPLDDDAGMGSEACATQILAWFEPAQPEALPPGTLLRVSAPFLDDMYIDDGGGRVVPLTSEAASSTWFSAVVPFPEWEDTPVGSF
jgi:hypothetical protein